jgi:hypothetical protein
MKTTIAILATSTVLAAAMQASLEKRFPNAEFKVIDKINDRPAGAQLASLGLPSFVPGTDTIKVLSFGSRIIQDATTEQRKHQWTVLRDPKASVEDVIAELGNWQEYSIQQGRAISDTKSAIADIQLALSEAEDDATRLKLYKEGYQALKALLS